MKPGPERGAVPEAESRALRALTSATLIAFATTFGATALVVVLLMG